MQKLNLAALLVMTCVLSLLSTDYVGAVAVGDPPEPVVYSPVFVTGLSYSNDQLDIIELYNDSSSPIDLSEWSVQYSSEYSGINCEIRFSDWILPDGYVLAVAEGYDVTGASESDVLRFSPCAYSKDNQFSFTLNRGLATQETVTPLFKSDEGKIVYGDFVRKGLTKTNRKGEFLSDFKIGIDRFNIGGWYSPLPISQLQISEIIINSRNCSPLESSLDCGDYVKLYNPTGGPIDLSNYRIRNGYTGQTPSSSNTFVLDGVLESGHFTVIPMSVLNGASWLWIEDSYGVKRYDNTVTEYPDGSSDTKKGQAWAYDESDGVWKWTVQPTPSDSPSVFPPEPIKEVTTTPTTYTPCAEGQYRSEETHRCRSIVSEVVSLIPCGPGQERNPDTNRCRSTTAVLGVSTLTPCKANQERNPLTNRCRNKVSAMPAAGFAPKQGDKSSTNYIMWWSLAGVISVAVAYGVWEWRFEITKLITKLKSSIIKG